MLLRCLLPLALLPLAAVASAACTLTDPTLTLQSYRVDAQKERIAMCTGRDRHGAKPGVPCVRCWRVSMATAGCRWR